MPKPLIADISSPPQKRVDALAFLGIEIEINHDCNRTCAYCPNAKLQRKHQGRMSEELFRKLLGQLQDMDYKGRVSYHFYNEPLLSPDLERYVALTREYLPSCRIELYTNGTLLTDGRLKDLVGLGVDKFIVTKHHGSSKYSFDEVYRNLPPQLKEQVKFQTYKEIDLTNRGGLVRVSSAGREPPLALPCLIPSALIVVTVNGNVLPCFNDFNEEHVMGNITEHSVIEIWNSSRFRKFREDLKAAKRADYSVCKGCNDTLIII